MILHVRDEIGVRELDGRVVHGVVYEVVDQLHLKIVWVSRDDMPCDVGYWADDPRLIPWGAA